MVNIETYVLLSLSIVTGFTYNISDTPSMAAANGVDTSSHIDDRLIRGSIKKAKHKETEEFQCVCFDFEIDEDNVEVLNKCPESGYCNTTGACFSHVSTFYDDEKVHEQKGCVETRDRARLMCRVKPSVSIMCCYGNLCNKNLNPTRPPIPSVSTSTDDANHQTMIVVIVVSTFFFFLLLSVVIMYFVRRCHKQRMQNLETHRKAGRMEGGLRTTHVGESTMADWMTSATSGSGCGIPYLIQRTMARQIQLVSCIGKGRYGEVWKGNFQGETVAVKVFSSRDEQSWARETEIYNTVLLRHTNILGYIGSDMTSHNSETKMWLVCYYHPYGSLYEFLQRRRLEPQQALKMCLTAANGLAHLHTDIVGVCGKAAIAHRDVKSKNILVKEDLSCCIADLGLAVTHNPSANHIDIPKNNHRVGTKRYMSPEVLDDSLNTSSFESFKQADVYSFSLVLWEVACRTITQGDEVEVYNPPYYDAVNYDPSFDEMRKVVCTDGYRPRTPQRWDSDPTIQVLKKLMTESWCAQASNRLTIHRMKKTLMHKLDTMAAEEADESLTSSHDEQPLV